MGKNSLLKHTAINFLQHLIDFIEIEKLQHHFSHHKHVLMRIRPAHGCLYQFLTIA